MISLHHNNIFEKGSHFHLADTIIREELKTYLHDHDFFEIFLLTSGCITHQVDGKETTLQEKSACLVYPGNKHCFSKKGCKEAVFTNMAFTTASFQDAWKYLIGSNPSLDSECKTIHEFPEHAWQSIILKLNWILGTPMDKDQGQQQLKSLLVELLSHFVRAGQRDIPVNVPSWLRKATRLMQEKENYTGGIERFVKLAGKTQEHLSRELRKHYQTTPSQFINSLRLTEAARLLRNTEKPVLNILYESGFQNVSFFNRLFKKRFGSSPRRYRKINYKGVVPR